MSIVEVNKNLPVHSNCVFFGVHKFTCPEICLVSSGVKFSRVSKLTAVSDKSQFNITIPPTDIKRAFFDCNTDVLLSTLIIETVPDSGFKICKALQIEPNQQDENSQEGSIRVVAQFTGQGVEIHKLLVDYFSVFSSLNWILGKVDSKIVHKYLAFLNNNTEQPSAPDLEISATKENEETKAHSILSKSIRTYSSLPQSTMLSPSTMRSSTPKQSPSLVRPKANVLKPKSTEAPSIYEIEIDSSDDDDDDTENQRSLNGSSSISDDHLFSYPPDEIDRISIHKSDLTCLDEGQYLNDTILGFYLKHIERHLTPPPIAERTYIFSTFFYHKLTHRPRTSEPVSQDNQTVSDRYYNRVKNWTKNINIFEKDFLIIPINKSYHWFLAIICYPIKVPDFDEILPIEIEKNPKRPCILFMDSLQSAHSKCGLAAPIRHFLSKEWESKKRNNPKKNFSKSVMPDIYLKVPKQHNSFDCGPYVIQYVENFLRNPDFLLEKTCKDPNVNLEDWFAASLVSSKRRTIKRLIKQLREAEEIKKNGNEDKMETDDS